MQSKRDDLSDLVMSIYKDRPAIAEMARQQYGPEEWDKLVESLLPEDGEDDA